MPLGDQPSMEAAIERALFIGDAIGWGHTYRVLEGSKENVKHNRKPGWYVCNSFGPNAYCETALKAVVCLYKEAPDFADVTSVEVVEG